MVEEPKVIRPRRSVKLFKEVAINNDCLGPAELQWVQSQAATWNGTIPKMPMPMRKMGLDRRKFLEWEETNSEYLEVKKAEWHHRVRYIKDMADIRRFNNEWRARNPFVSILSLIVEDNAVYEQRSYYARVRSPTSPEGGTYTKADIEEIRLKQKNRCKYFKYCGISFDGAKFHIDHKVAVTRGGGSTKDNLQLLCISCNARKQTMRHEVLVRKLRMVV